jgi:hypothetical protein
MGFSAEVVWTMRTLHIGSTCLVVVALAASLGGCGGGTNSIEMTPPNLASVSPDVSRYGDTLVVTGSGFGERPADNRIVISPGRFSDPAARREIVPVAGSRTMLRGIVPDGSFTGSVRIEEIDPLGGSFPFGVEPPTAASNARAFDARLLAGNVGKSFFSGSSYDFSIDAGASSEDYLVIVFSNAVPPSNTWGYLYSVTTQGETTLAGAREGRGAAPKTAEKPPAQAPLSELMARDLGIGRLDIHAHADTEIAELLKRSGGPRGSSAGASAFRSKIGGPGAAPETAQFQVLTTATGSVLDPANFTTVEANLMYTGEHTLLYVDVETPALFLTEAEAQDLGQVYDAAIYPTDRTYFGSESDINHDGKVAILLSPVVNRMTPAGTAGSQGFIAGFFLMNDLLPGLLDSRTTNGMEIFYGMVPDPTGQFGNIFPKAQTLPVIEGVLAHEFLHMILFNYRVLIYGRGYLADYMEELWMNEGLAHIAEDLNGYDSSNIGRANLFLDDPWEATLIYGGDELKERGASFLFLRLLGDRFGDGIYKKLVQTKKYGTANVEAQTGGRFEELFADWIAALSLSGRGITSDQRFNYTSLDLPGAFHPVRTISAMLGAQMGGSIRSMAPVYLSYSVPASGAYDFTVGSEASGRMNAVVIRLH